MKAFIKDIAYYLPERVVTNQELIKDFPEWSVEKVASKVGIQERHLVVDGETATDLAIKAAEQLFISGKVKKEDVDFILFCTQSPDYVLPTSACLIQNRLKLSSNVGALDFNLGCSGFVYGLSLAKGLICGGIARNVLLLTGETYSLHIHPKDKGNRTIFGDAATATLISTEGIGEIGDFSLGTDGSGASNLIVKTGAFRNPQRKNDLFFDENKTPISSDYLYMNGTEIFNFTLEAVPLLVRDVLLKNNITQSDIGLYVFHQANKYMINVLRKKLKIEEERFFIYLEKVGNTVSSTIPIALFQAQKENKLNGHVLLAGFGVGYSWGGVVLNFK